MPPPHALEAKLIAAVGEIAGIAGLRLAVWFGSSARGEPGARDVDLALLGDGALDLVDLTNRLTRALERQDIDVADLRTANPVLLALVAREGRPIYERTPGEFARFASYAVRRFADTRKFRETARQELRELTEGAPPNRSSS